MTKKELTSPEISDAIKTLRTFQKQFVGLNALAEKLEEVQATTSGKASLEALRADITDAASELETIKTEASNTLNGAKGVAAELVESAKTEASKLVALAHEEAAAIKKDGAEDLNKTIVRRRKVLNELEEDIGEAALKLQGLQDDIKKVEEKKAQLLSALGA